MSTDTSVLGEVISITAYLVLVLAAAATVYMFAKIHRG